MSANSYRRILGRAKYDGGRRQRHPRGMGRHRALGGIALAILPVGVIVFPGTGIQENLSDKAGKLGIPVMKFDGGA